MKISKRDNDNRRAYLVTTDNNDIALIDSDGLVMASSSAKIIGNHIIMHSLPGLKSTSEAPKQSYSQNGSHHLAQNLISSADNHIMFELFISDDLIGEERKWNSTDQFVNRLTTHDKLTDDLTAQYENDARVLGYNLTEERSAIIIELVDFYKGLLSVETSENKEKIINLWKNKIINSLTSFFTQNHDMIVSYLGRDRFVVFKCLGRCTEQRYHKLLKTAHKSIINPLKNDIIKDIYIGIGNVYIGLRGLYDSYKEAETALKIGKIFYPHSKCTFFEDLGILSILADGDEKRKNAFANKLLKNINNKSSLLKTLEVFFSNDLNITTTAEKIGIHRNTVIYRLDQLSKHIGMDPRIFHNAVIIKIALIIRDIQMV